MDGQQSQNPSQSLMGGATLGTPSPATAPSQSVGGGGAPPSTPTPDAAMQALIAENQQLRGIYAELAPFAEEINWLTSDEKARKIARDKDLRNYVYEAVDQLENIKARQTPPIPPELKPLEEKVDKVSSFVDELKKREEAAVAAQQQQAYKTNYEFAQKLVGERPELAADNYRGIKWLMAVATSENTSLEDAYKLTAQVFPQAESGGQRPIPPRSLRGDAGDAGIPGPQSRKITSPSDLKALVAGRLKKAGLGG